MSQGRFQRIPSDSFPGTLVDGRTVTAAGGGTSITSTLSVAQVLPFLNNTKHVVAQPWNYSTAVVLQALLCPYLWIVKGTAINVPAPPTLTDYSVQGQQPGGTGITLSSLSTLALGEAFYLGAGAPFAGVAVDMSAATNSNASVLLVEYWNGTSWVSLSATDGTTTGGHTFGQDGLVTWTMPAAGAWAKTRFSDGLQFPPTTLTNATLDNYCGSDQLNAVPQYWTRWTVSAALDSSTVANTMLALNQSTAYTEILSSNVLEFRPVKQHGGVSALQCKTDAGTVSLIITCYTDNPDGAF